MIAVTTTLAFWVLDPEQRVAWQIDCGKGVYYGVSFSQDELFVACRQARFGADRPSQHNIILRYGRDLRLKEVLRPLLLRDVHQIVVSGGALLVCDSFDDAVLHYAIDTGGWRTWRPLGDVPLGTDLNHINSVWADGAGTYLCGTRPQGWWAKVDVPFQLAEKRLLGNEPHNIWIEDGQVMVCSSKDGALMREDGTVLPLAANAWARGVCRRDGRRYVGLSQMRQQRERGRSDCSVVRMDPAGGLDGVWSFRRFGMVHDMRTVGEPDPTHNGVSFDLEPDALDDRFPRYEPDDRLIAFD
jgi:hypothetical protein